MTDGIQTLKTGEEFPGPVQWGSLKIDSITILRQPNGELELVGGKWPQYVAFSTELLSAPVDSYYAGLFKAHGDEVEVVVSETVRQRYQLMQGQSSPFSTGGFLFVRVDSEVDSE